jgi:PRC-barrel domain protein
MIVPRWLEHGKSYGLCPSGTKIGEIKDILVSKDEKISAFIISAGSFLGAGQKDVAVSVDQAKETISVGSR